jgi:hypothetical protein
VYYYMWGDGTTGGSKTFYYVTSPQFISAIYRVSTNLVKEKLDYESIGGSSYHTVRGWVDSIHGRGVCGATVNVVFHYTSIFGSYDKIDTVTTDSNGYFLAKAQSEWYGGQLQSVDVSFWKKDDSGRDTYEQGAATWSWTTPPYPGQKAKVTFAVRGMRSDATGVVLVVDCASYYYSGLPITFEWTVGSTHTFEWKYSVAASGGTYYWSSTSGSITTSRSGTFTVPSISSGDSAWVRATYTR